MKRTKIINRLMSLITAMVLMLSTSTFAFADGYDYETDTSITYYSFGVNDNGTFTRATQKQRDVAGYMRERAGFEWGYPGATTTYYYAKYSDSDGDGTEEPITSSRIDISKEINGLDVFYKGILYQQKKADWSNSLTGSREHWLSSGNDIRNAVVYMYTSPHKRCVRGTDCSSSTCYAWRSKICNNDMTNGILMSKFSWDQSRGLFHSTYNCDKIVKDGNRTSGNDSLGIGNYISRVGNYGSIQSSDNTSTMISRLESSGDIYDNVYALMKTGDFLVKSVSGSAHARLVEKVIINRNSNGTINPSSSYVLTSEQTSTMKYCNDNNDDSDYYTTWVIGSDCVNGKKYSFSNLASTGYLPYRYNNNVASMVTSFVCDEVSDTSVLISWYAQKPKFCSGYEIEYSDNPDFAESKTIVIENPSTSDIKIDNLDKDKTYYFRAHTFVLRDNEETEYSAYNNWLSVNMKNGELYRENAPDPKKVSKEEYNDYIYNDVARDYYVEVDSE